MGRGRAKAKQTKVARQLKYGGPTTDLERLQAELAGSTPFDSHDSDETEESDADAELEDPYARYADAPGAGDDLDDEVQPHAQ